MNTQPLTMSSVTHPAAPRLWLGRVLPQAVQPTLLKSGFDCSWGALGATLYSPGSKVILHERERSRRSWPFARRRRQSTRSIGRSLPSVCSTILVTLSALSNSKLYSSSASLEKNCRSLSAPNSFFFANPASIVLNSSVNAHVGMPNTTIYAASKAGLISLVRTLSGELISRGIRVNAVSPGPTSTPLYGKLGFSAEQLKAVAASIKGQVPAGRFGNPSEIAHAVVFFASDESAFTIGSELLIDGGMSNL